jgi:dienelactone hydrolase
LIIDASGVSLRGLLSLPGDAQSVIVLAYDTVSHRYDPARRYVASMLQEAGCATLTIDLLSDVEERLDAQTGRYQMDVPQLAGRLDSVVEPVLDDPRTRGLPIGYFGSGVGAAAALVAAVQRPESVRAVVCWNGRTDLARSILPDIRPPVLLIVGPCDTPLGKANAAAARKLRAERELIVRSAWANSSDKQFELSDVARKASAWFARHLIAMSAATSTAATSNRQE